MGEILVAVALLASFTVIVAMEFTKRRLLARPPLARPAKLPPVSVLKPLRGADPGLEANLETAFRLDYPEFEIVLGAADADDAGLAVARRVAARHPEVPSTIVIDARRVGMNPKVDNLANLFRRARHDLVLVSDSNVALPRDYLADLVAHHASPDVGLATSIFRGAPGRGFGARLEALQIDAFVAGGIAIASSTGRICVVGKSMLLARRDLGRIGGLRFLGRFLAEDQVCGEEMAKKGLRVVVARRVVENRLGDLSVGDAVARHLRWARIRRAINPVAYASEILLCPVALAAAGALVLGTPTSIALLAVAASLKLALDVVATTSLGGRIDAWLPLASLARDFGVAALWPVAWFGRKVTWRGNTLRVGPRTLLESVEREPEFVPARAARPSPVAHAALVAR
jgi:ceramide glucosyltransferase